MRVFSIKRLVVSLILGFLVPFGYAVFLFFLDDILKLDVPQFLIWPFSWPRQLWILLMQRQPSDADLAHGLAFIAACNMVLYGSIIYVSLSVLSLIRRKPAAGESPPPPAPF